MTRGVTAKESVIYQLRRLDDGTCEVLRGGTILNHRLDLFNHSPSGLEWGYGGSGPAQTALAILADFLEDDERAVSLHQRFKFALIGAMERAGGDITGRQILEFLHEVGDGRRGNGRRGKEPGK